MRLSRIHGVKNQFRDQRVTGIDSYDKAKRDMAKDDDWESEVKGIEMIVAIARDRPEVTALALIAVVTVIVIIPNVIANFFC